MKKEVVLAILIGFALGLIIMFGIWSANKSLKEAAASVTPTPTQNTIVSSPTPSNSQPTTDNSKISITSPEDESVTNSGTTTLTGKTTPNGMVVITSETDEYIIQADATGNFTQKIDLTTGYNTLTCTAVDANGKTTPQSIIVTYTTAKI